MLALVWAAQHFRANLYGWSFLARTDHQLLKWLRSFKEPEGQVARWLEALAEYDFEVVHRPGRQHMNADGLTRQHCQQCGQQCNAAVTATSQQQEAEAVLSVENWPSWEPEELGKQQGDDPDVNKAFISTREGAWPDSIPLAESQVFQSLWAQRQQLSVVDGLLYRKWEDVGGRGGNPGLQLVLPRTLVIQVLLLMHDNATAGHLGMQKTLAKIRSRFYWVGQRKDVEEWCRMCILKISPGCLGAYESCSNWRALSVSGNGHNWTFSKNS